MSEETLSRIAGWCQAEDDLSIEGSTITVAGVPPLELTVEIGSDALGLIHTHSVAHPPHGFTDRAAGILGRRGSMVTGEVVTGAASTAVHLRYPIYLEGLNRQSFLVGVREITATVDALERLAEPTGGGSEEHPTREIATGPAPPPSQPDPRPKPVTAAPPWAPTHVVPASGMAAWSSPDPSLAPVANLSPGVQLRVDQQRGAWAAVTGSNGWTGWVDARILQWIGGSHPTATPAWSAAAGGGAAAARRPAQEGVHLPALIGGILLIGSAFLEWMWTSAMNASVAGVWPIYHIKVFSQPRIGMILIVIGVLAVIAAALPQMPRVLPAVAGGIALLLVAGVAIGFVVDFSFGWDPLDFVDTGWIGFWMALVGGILALIPRRRTG